MSDILSGSYIFMDYRGRLLSLTTDMLYTNDVSKSTPFGSPLSFIDYNTSQHCSISLAIMKYDSIVNSISIPSLSFTNTLRSRKPNNNDQSNMLGYVNPIMINNTSVNVSIPIAMNSNADNTIIIKSKVYSYTPQSSYINWKWYIISVSQPSTPLTTDYSYITCYIYFKTDTVYQLLTTLDGINSKDIIVDTNNVIYDLYSSPCYNKDNSSPMFIEWSINLYDPLTFINKLSATDKLKYQFTVIKVNQDADVDLMCSVPNFRTNQYCINLCNNALTTGPWCDDGAKRYCSISSNTNKPECLCYNDTTPYKHCISKLCNIPLTSSFVSSNEVEMSCNSAALLPLCDVDVIDNTNIDLSLLSTICGKNTFRYSYPGKPACDGSNINCEGMTNDEYNLKYPQPITNNKKYKDNPNIITYNDSSTDLSLIIILVISIIVIVAFIYSLYFIL